MHIVEFNYMRNSLIEANVQLRSLQHPILQPFLCVQQACLGLHEKRNLHCNCYLLNWLLLRCRASGGLTGRIRLLLLQLLAWPAGDFSLALLSLINATWLTVSGLSKTRIRLPNAKFGFHTIGNSTS